MFFRRYKPESIRRKLSELEEMALQLHYKATAYQQALSSFHRPGATGGPWRGSQSRSSGTLCCSYALWWTAPHPPSSPHTQQEAEGTAQMEVPLCSHLQERHTQECKYVLWVCAAERPEPPPFPIHREGRGTPRMKEPKASWDFSGQTLVTRLTKSRERKLFISKSLTFIINC